MEKAIITVVGKDQVGIISRICSYLADQNINILDISQTILDGYFNMMMIVDNTHAKSSLDMMSHDLETIGNELGVVAKIQHENIFAKMHRI